jgi:hypothetical protein
MPTWISDENNNRCSVEYFGSEENAKKALATLTNCSDCSDCSRCYRCSNCSRCYDCSDCSDCSRCYRCSDCSDCSRCYECSRCSRCYDLKKASPVQSGDEVKPLEIPVIPNIHIAIYEAASKPEALEMSDWHTCEKTHCRAGWAVTLAGEAGRELEKRFDTLSAAMKIYDASDPNFRINPCRFFDDNDAALADMKKLAEGTK